MSNITFTSLGGLQEVGTNSYVYGIKKRSEYIVVDLGIGFRNPKYPFLDTFIPDLSFFGKKNKLKGLFVTHGHEDHIGAIEYYYHSLLKDIPIYATPFTAALIRNKLKYHDIKNPKIIEVTTGKPYKISGLKVTFIPIEHSIPESNMLLIESDTQSILHSGDFRINHATFKPKDVLKYLPKRIDYLFCESTNASKDRDYQPETAILPDLTRIIKEANKAVWVTMFASNVERLNNVLKIATKNNRKIVLLGKSVQNYFNTGLKFGYIDPVETITFNDVNNYKRGELLYIVTGSQGEPTAFLQRVLSDNLEKGLRISKGDSVVFLSKPIPGNELRVHEIQDKIAAKEAFLFDSSTCLLHVSGHAYRSEIEKLIQTTKPLHIVPIHGDMAHLKALQNIADKLKISSTVLANGDVIELGDPYPKLIDSLENSKLSYEGKRLVSLEDIPFKERRKMMFDGIVTVSLVLLNGVISNHIQLKIIGLLKESEQKNYVSKLIKKIQGLRCSSATNSLEDQDNIQRKITTAVKHQIKADFGKKPLVSVNIFDL